METEDLYRLSFIGEWFQEEAGMERKFCIFYFPGESSIELFDVKSKKTFLKRTKMKEITKNDFYIGAKVNIFGRQIEILDYADNLTRTKLSAARTRTFILLQGSLVHRMGEIITVLNDNGIIVSNGRMVKFTIESTQKFLGGSEIGNVELTVLINKLIQAPCVGFEIMAKNVLERIKRCIVQDETSKGEDIALRTFFEDEDIRNYFYCSKSEKIANKEIGYFFDYKNELTSTVSLMHTTLAIIKPHAVREGKTGPIINEFYQNGFRVTGLKMLRMERVNSEEFYEVYRGVLSEYIQMAAQLASGICMVVELESVDLQRDPHAEFRKLCGPMDPEIAKHLRPNTLRAKYGKDKILNALHCTDLPEDCLMEIEYFFKILI